MSRKLDEFTVDLIGLEGPFQEMVQKQQNF